MFEFTLIFIQFDPPTLKMFKQIETESIIQLKISCVMLVRLSQVLYFPAVFSHVRKLYASEKYIEFLVLPWGFIQSTCFVWTINTTFNYSQYDQQCTGGLRSKQRTHNEGWIYHHQIDTTFLSYSPRFFFCYSLSIRIPQLQSNKTKLNIKQFS